MTNSKVMNFVTVSVLALGLVACSPYNSSGGINKQQVGTVAGGAVGALVGSQAFHGKSRTTMIVASAIAGSLIGSSIGQRMDEQDRLLAERAVTSVPVGQEAAWTNSNTGASYTVRPVSQTRTSSGYCRRALTTVTLDGRTQRAYTTVCKHRDGRWYVRN